MLDIQPCRTLIHDCGKVKGGKFLRVPWRVFSVANLKNTNCGFKIGLYGKRGNLNILNAGAAYILIKSVELIYVYFITWFIWIILSVCPNRVDINWEMRGWLWMLNWRNIFGTCYILFFYIYLHAFGKSTKIFWFALSRI